jgi:hypothetical protein
MKSVTPRAVHFHLPIPKLHHYPWFPDRRMEWRRSRRSPARRSGSVVAGRAVFVSGPFVTRRGTKGKRCGAALRFGMSEGEDVGGSEKKKEGEAFLPPPSVGCWVVTLSLTQPQPDSRAQADVSSLFLTASRIPNRTMYSACHGNELSG